VGDGVHPKIMSRTFGDCYGGAFAISPQNYRHRNRATSLTARVSRAATWVVRWVKSRFQNPG